MLAAAAAAKDRLRSGARGRDSNRGSPGSRKPVCSEDEAAQRALLYGQSANNSSSSCNVPQPISQLAGYGGYASSYAPPTGSGSAFGARPEFSYASPLPKPLAPGSLRSDPAAQAAYGGLQPRNFQALQPRMASGGYALGGASTLEAGRGGSSSFVKEEQVEEDDDGPKVEPLVTVRLVCCYALLLVIGAVFGAVAHDLSWIDLSPEEPFLQALERWLHEPHEDTAHGGTHCEDGILLGGPPRTGASTLLYVSLLIWSFLGVAIAADVFMAGIEQITSQEASKTIVLPSGEVRRYSVTVWNATVANLTLMALGSSAPEIMLSIIEIFSSGFYAGELGPSTIVGSAAFNMLGISAVCVASIPDGSGRSIKELPVFYTTGAFSLGAYVWLLYILSYSSPNLVTPLEGLVTFCLFPALVIFAYRADLSNDGPPVFEDSPEGAEAYNPIGYDKTGKQISKSDVSRVIALKTIEKLSGEEQIAAVASMLLPPNVAQSKAFYRKEGMRSALGGAPTAVSSGAAAMRLGILEQEHTNSNQSITPVVEWAQAARLTREATGKVEIAIVRTGDLGRQSSIDYKTKSGTATEGVDFEAMYGTMSFLAGESLKIITVKIINDDEEEDDEHFYVQLLNPKGCTLGSVSTCDVTIQDDDGPGELHFDSREIEVFESASYAVVNVMRTHGCEGVISCMWGTRDASALSGTGYESAEGRLEFGDGVTSKALKVKLVDTGAYHRADDFQIVLYSAAASENAKKKPARFVTDSVTRTKRTSIFATVHVLSDRSRQARVDEMVALLDFSQNTSVATPATSDTWGEQFDEATTLPTDGSSVSLVLWLLSLPWKIIGACVPPPAVGDGWACFFVALLYIGSLTALIGDLAAHTGCCLGLEKSVTAITFVALGTSLPDTFASRAAAINEPHADSAIVNITGSNSVNVFLGLGLPWAAAAFYWAAFASPSAETAWHARYKSEPWYTPGMPVGFAVPAGGLAYTVEVFLITASTCLATLILRRAVFGFELGGPTVWKYVTALFFIGLWLTYISLSVIHSSAEAAAPSPSSFRG